MNNLTRLMESVGLNFAVILFTLLVITGGVWLLDVLLLRRARGAGAREPWWVEYPKSFFPVILAVFALRSFLVEPFKIPSGSMLPTLLVGDFILVNKYTYGIRLPILNRKVVEINQPQRGDVMVFRYPEDPSMDFIKRVVGVPGDVVSYHDKQLVVNGQPVAAEADGTYGYIDKQPDMANQLNFISAAQYQETLNGVRHAILIHPGQPDVQASAVRNFPYRTNCDYNETGFTCTVPAGHYFMMGDNRDASSDSRYWGFVPDANIVGKAFMIWWNFDDFGRIGGRVH